MVELAVKFREVEMVTYEKGRRWDMAFAM